jgi:hypothetical protein
VKSVQWLFWEHSFVFSEAVLYGAEQNQELERFVNQTRPCSPVLKAADSFKATLESYYSRATNKARRLLTQA